MPHIPCPISITCGSPTEVDDPRANFSSELPDVIRFGATGWAPPTIDPGLPPGDPPVVPNGYIAQGCVSICFSSVSQEEANLCAANQAFLCAYGQNGCNGQVCPTTFGAPTPPTVFFNQVQQCAFTCPDGNQFITTIGAGTFAALTQAEADQIAHEYACEIAAHSFICLGDLASKTCLGQHYSSTVNATGGDKPISFSIASGSLPPGLNLSIGLDQRSFTISGTATVPGDYTFQIGAVDASAHKAFKVYTISVGGITNTSPLPQGTYNRPYAETIQAVGGDGIYTFHLTLGSLPAGLSLNTVSGAIHGTPTSKLGETQIFTITASNNTFSCSKEFSLTIVQAPGPDWNTITWVGVTAGTCGDGSATVSAVGRQLTTNLRADSAGACDALCNAGANMPYTGPAFNFEIDVSVLISDASTGGGTVGIEVGLNGVAIYDNFNITANMVISIPIPAQVAGLITIVGKEGGNDPTLARAFTAPPKPPGTIFLNLQIFNN